MEMVMRMTTRLAMGLAASFVLAAGTALAEENDSSETGFLDKSIEWLTTDTYVGLQLGTASADTSTSSLVASLPGIDTLNSASIDDGGLAYRLFFGKRIMEHFSAEVGFADVGDIDVNVDAEVLDDDVPAYMQQLANNAPVAPAGLVFDAVGDWTFADLGVEGDWGEEVSLYGRLGLFLWETEVKYRVEGTTYKSTDDGVDLHFGLGASYRINEQFDVRFEWESYQSDTKSSMIGFGAAYHF